MQKKILALHDLSGFGRSSLVPIISVLSAHGHQCVPLPTAVFSTHTAIPNWVVTDLTNAMRDTIDQYDTLGLRFEAIYAGFLGSAAQIDRVAFLVGHHHTLIGIDNADYQILLEADYIVNASENGYGKESIRGFLSKTAKTDHGIKLIRQLFHI